MTQGVGRLNALSQPQLERGDFSQESDDHVIAFHQVAFGAAN